MQHPNSIIDFRSEKECLLDISLASSEKLLSTFWEVLGQKILSFMENHIFYVSVSKKAHAFLTGIETYTL